MQTPNQSEPVGGREAEGGKAAPASALPCLFVTTTTEPSPAYLAKKAETLFLNLENLIERVGIEHIGFITLTFAENLQDRKEAQKRFKYLHNGFFKRDGRVAEYIAAVERQMRGAIHFHLVAAMAFDVRANFNIELYQEACRAKTGYDGATYRRLQSKALKSANPELKQWWRDLRDKAALYHFGRCETIPVLSNVQAVARYVGKYVTKEAMFREARDKGLRTLRYSLEYRKCAARWSFVEGNAAIFRKGCAVLSALIQTEDFTATLGNRWAYHWREQIFLYGLNFAKCFAAVRCISDENDFMQRVNAAARLATMLREHPNTIKTPPAKQLGTGK